MVISPAVGEVMFESSLRTVLLPAPLWPMMPSVSPRRTAKLTSRSAQNSSARRRKALSLRSHGWSARSPSASSRRTR